MEERQPINPEDLPETEQPKHDAFYTIGIACLIFLFIIVEQSLFCNQKTSNVRDKKPQMFVPKQKKW